jgi:transcriptional regulator with XRE-family HTH domain
MLEDQEDNIEAVAARLRRVRDILGLTKKEFSERAGMTEQTYGPFENARRELSLSAAKKLRKRYGLPLEFMYFGKIEDLPTRISKDL